MYHETNKVLGEIGRKKRYHSVVKEKPGQVWDADLPLQNEIDLADYSEQEMHLKISGRYK